MQICLCRNLSHFFYAVVIALRFQRATRLGQLEAGHRNTRPIEDDKAALREARQQ